MVGNLSFLIKVLNENSPKDLDTLLVTAAEYGNTGIIKFLLSKEANINGINPSSGSTALISAILSIIDREKIYLWGCPKDRRSESHEYFKIEILEKIQFLLDNGANINKLMQMEKLH